MLAWLMNLGFAASGSDAPPIVVEATQTPAGRRRRLYVEIDGQSFSVDTEAQAVQLLQRARALAEHQAEQKAEIATKRLRRKEIVPRVQLTIPEITVSPDLQAVTAPLIADIERLYNKAAELAELRLLLARQMADEEDDDDVLLLI